MKNLDQSDQNQFLDVLDQQKIHQRKVDRVLYIVLPVIAFLLCVMCANYNWQSTLGTFLMLLIAFIAVGIRRLNLRLWLVIVAVYSLVDIYLTYSGQLPIQAVGRQMGTMLSFVGILGIGRPYIDRWLMK
jgi:hypothetical protein